MTETRCPRCDRLLSGLPVAASIHPVSRGHLDYLRCFCGSWLARVNGVVVGATSASTGVRASIDNSRSS